MAKTELVDVEGELVKPFETEKAWHFYDGRTTSWLPKSQVEWHPEKGNAGTMVIPRWLAEQEGLE
jgi:hypothetical protein